MPLPIPADDDKRMEPQVRYFEFLTPENWMEVFSRLGASRQEGSEENDLYECCQAVMAEVGYQHSARAAIVDALEPDSHSLEDTLSAIKDLRSRESMPAPPASAPAQTSSGPANPALIQLAVANALARVVTIPSELAPAMFLDLTKEITDGILGEPAPRKLSQEVGPEGDAEVIRL